MGERIDPLSDSIPESEEVQRDRWWRKGGGFRWCWPHVDKFHPAIHPRDRSWRVGLNRYPHNVIGAYIVAGRRGWGIRWKDSYSSSRRRQRDLRKMG